MIPTKKHADDGEGEDVGYAEGSDAPVHASRAKKTAIILRIVFALSIALVGYKESQVLWMSSSPTSHSHFFHENEDGVHSYGLDTFSWHTNLSRTITTEKCRYMDVVFTWANGTDPAYVKEWEQAANKKMDRYGKLRSTDHGTLRFAIRSVVAYVPFMRNLILVTNNQIPSWIKEDNPRLRILSTQDIFVNKSHLPSFNSNSIEANLQNIPGLSECFLYSCDDFFIARNVTMSDFVMDDGRSILYMSYDHIAPYTKGKSKKSRMWHKSIEVSNDVLNKHYHPYEAKTARHYYVDHIVYFFRKSALDYMHKIWSKELARTSAQKFRSENDMVISYLHHNMLLEEGAGVPVFEKGKTIRWTNTRKRNAAKWNKMSKNGNITGFCVQDEFKYGKNPGEIERESNYLVNLLCNRFPYQTSFERGPNPCNLKNTRRRLNINSHESS